MTCPNCSTSNRESARFCRNCGLWLAAACPNCGTQLPERPVFCDWCGYQVSPLAAAGPAWIRPGAAAPAGPGMVASAVQPSAVDPQPYRSVTPPAAPQTLPPAASRSGLRPPPDELTPASAGGQLRAFIPPELAVKLEAARASGEMVGERRIVTMLFCDVKGSTAAAERLDPEDWTEIMNGAFEHMIKPVYHYEGTLARLMGDALLAFFGAPIAHEDDPQRAILAGLDIVAAIAPYREHIRRQWDMDFDVRIGINTGLVVVGAVGSDLRVEYSALGDAINLAARMEQTAAPGTVRIAHDTYRLVKPLFEFEELGGVEIKGKSEPVLAYRVLGRKAVAGRARGIEGLYAEMVGRQDELTALRSVLADLKQGVGRIVSVLGEAGLGKSRLTAEAHKLFKDYAGPDSNWFETSSLSYETHQAYALFQRLIRRVYGIAYDDSAAVVRQKLVPLLECVSAVSQPQAASVLETLFSLEPESNGHARTGELQGEAFKRVLFDTMEAWWRACFAEPTVLLFDDMHWSDAASVELLLHLLPLTESIPLVILCALRPDRQAPAWQVRTLADEQYPHRYTEVLLRPLSLAESSELVNRLLTIADLPDRLRASILEKSGGNPFFVEEVVRTLIDRGAVVAEDHAENGVMRRYWHASSAGADFEIPDNLQSLLAARMDRLEEETRQTLQLASVIGRSFYYRVLNALAAGGSPAGATVELDRHLSALVRLEMIQEAARVPEVEYKFRNPLMQEATYRTILLKRRRDFHRRVGEAMESLFADRLAELGPRLGFHFAEGGDPERALKYFTAAADSAYRLYAIPEAIAQYDRALELAPAAHASVEQLVHLFRTKGRALELNSQHAEALANYERMEALGLSQGQPTLELAAIVAQGTIYSTANDRFDEDRARGLAERALALAQSLGDGAAEARIHWNLLNLNRFSAHAEEALQHAERSLELARALGLREQEAYTLNDTYYVHMTAGHVAEAQSTNAQAREIWRELGILNMLADNLGSSVIVDIFNGSLDAAIASSDEAYAISQSIGNQWGQAFSRMSIGTAFWTRGDFDRSIEIMRTSAAQAAQAGFLVGEVWPTAELGLVYAVLGQPQRGLAAAEQAHANIQSLHGPPAVSNAYLSRVYLALGNMPAAASLLLEGNGLQLHNPMSKALVLWSRTELFASRQDYPMALQACLEFRQEMDGTWGRLLWPSVSLVQGRAHHALGQTEAACQALRSAVAEADSMGMRWWKWQALAALAELEAQAGHTAEAALLRQQARELVDYIAAHLSIEDLRASFLALPDVKALRAT